jgi:hypothetical protein
MTARLVVAAVFVLAAAAAGDALREPGAEERTRARPPDAPEQVRFAPPRPQQFRAVGAFLSQRVVRAGKEYLSAEQVDRAFPGDAQGPLDISKVVQAPDGTLVLAVYRFPPGRAAVGALQFWQGKRLQSAFTVPPGFFGGGLAFDRTGRYVALFSHDGQLRGIYDRRGRLQEGLPEIFLDAG